MSSSKKEYNESHQGAQTCNRNPINYNSTNRGIQTEKCCIFCLYAHSWFLSFFTHVPFVSQYIFYTVLQVNCAEKKRNLQLDWRTLLISKATKHRSNWVTKFVVFGASPSKNDTTKKPQCNFSMVKPTKSLFYFFKSCILCK